MTAFLICFKGSFMNLKRTTNPPPETSSFLKCHLCSSFKYVYFTVSSQAPLVLHECEGFRGKTFPVPDPWLFCIHYVPWCLWMEREVTYTLQNGSTWISSNSTISVTSVFSHMACLHPPYHSHGLAWQTKGRSKNPSFFPNFQPSFNCWFSFSTVSVQVLQQWTGFKPQDGL